MGSRGIHKGSLLSHRGREEYGNARQGPSGSETLAKTADDIAEKVAGEITSAEVYYALELLEKKDYITEADSIISPDRAAFWHVLGLKTALGREPDEGDHGLGYQVRNRAHQALCVRPSALAALNIQTAEDSEFAVVLTDD